MHEISIEQKKKRISGLINEVLSGEYKKDVLINSAYDFSGELQAMYYANMRKNMKSDMASAVINHGQQLDDLTILKGLGKYEQL